MRGNFFAVWNLNSILYNREHNLLMCSVPTSRRPCYIFAIACIIDDFIISTHSKLLGNRDSKICMVSEENRTTCPEAHLGPRYVIQNMILGRGLQAILTN